VNAYRHRYADRIAPHLCRWQRSGVSSSLLFRPAIPFGWIGGVHGGINLSDDPSRIACYDRKLWYVFGNHTACSDGAALADGDTGQDDRIASDPAVFTNVNLLPHLWASRALAYCGVERMISGVEGNIWAHKRAAADGDEARVKEDGEVVDEHVLSDLYVEAVIHVHRRLNPGIVIKQLIIIFRRRSQHRQRRFIAQDADNRKGQESDTSDCKTHVLPE
jgi:hypothetical protein